MDSALAVIDFAPSFGPVFIIRLFATRAERDNVVFVFFISGVLVVSFRPEAAASVTTANKPVEPTPWSAYSWSQAFIHGAAHF
jgi:hypothetical protein